MAMAQRASAARYFGTYLALVALAAGSLLLSFVHWPGGVVVALAIALLKALLVLWLFMHLGEQRLSSRLAMLVAAMFIALLAGLAAADVASRHTLAARPRPPGDDTFYRR